MRIVLCVLLITVGGCSFLAPGYDTRQAHEARNYMEWNADGSVMMEDETTHNGITIMADGRLVLNEDGTINQEASMLDSYFYRKSDPTDVANSYQKLAVENARAFAAMMKVVSQAVDKIPIPASGPVD